MDILPYNQDAEPETETIRANGVHASSTPNGLRNEALEHTANAGLTQRLECDPYTVEVGGSNPSARTIPLTRGYVALLDEEDYQRFGHLKWTAGRFGRATGYAYRSVWVGDKCHSVLLHRAILGARRGQIVDHINGDTFDNRRVNLRFVTPSQNAINSRRTPSRSGFIGIRPSGRRWVGVVKSAGRIHRTKSFRSAVLAAAARDVLARKLHGEYAVLNFPASAIRPGA